MLRRLLPILAFLLCPLPSYADIQLSSPTQFAPSSKSPWQLLTVEYTSPSNVASQIEIQIQDARGGPIISRPLANTRGWITLPLIDPASLQGSWRVHASIRANNRILESRTIELPLKNNSPATRIAAPSDLLDAAHRLPWEQLTANAPALFAIPIEEIHSAPVTLFAACDLLIVPAANPPSEERLFALAAAGIRILIISDDRPTPRLDWQKIDPAGTTTRTASGSAWRPSPTAWIWPPAPFIPPSPIEPDLPSAGLLQPAKPGATFLLTTLGAAPAAIVVLLLARGLFRRRFAVAAASAAGLALLTAGTCALLYSQADIHRQQASWTQSNARPAPLNILPEIQLQESVAALSPLLARTCELRASSSEFFWPLADSAGEYWRLRDLTLHIDADTQRIIGTVPARHVLTALTRRGQPFAPPTASLEGQRTLSQLLTSRTTNPLIPGAWLLGGYIQAPPGTFLFTEWQKSHPLQRDLQAWYALRFQGSRNYYLWETHSPHFLEPAPQAGN